MKNGDQWSPFIFRTFLRGHLRFLGHITTANPTSPVVFPEALASLTHIQPDHILRETDPVTIQDVSPQCLYESEYPHRFCVKNLKSSKSLIQMVNAGSPFWARISNS